MFVMDAVAQGAQIVTGGARDMIDTGGYFMQPTVVTGVKPEGQIYREEVFGPVLSVTWFKDEQEALRLANASTFGLASGVCTANLSRAHRMIRGIRASVVHVNAYGGADVTVPLGGVNQSGNGHDKSLHARGKYTDLKTAWIQL
jgi:gamma-glutamyl-gamma-aminobutyraldehyde dehydrogenase